MLQANEKQQFKILRLKFSEFLKTNSHQEGKPVFEFGYGLTYSEIEEKWTDENTVVLTNKGNFDVNYSVLKFEYIPHKNLCGFKKQYILAGESITVKF